MRDRWDLTERLFAAYYPRIMQRSENAGQRATRAELLAGAAGPTLEIGTGNGADRAVAPEDPAAELRALAGDAADRTPDDHRRSPARLTVSGAVRGA
jgi:hypothetical protein